MDESWHSMIHSSVSSLTLCHTSRSLCLKEERMKAAGNVEVKGNMETMLQSFNPQQIQMMSMMFAAAANPGSGAPARPAQDNSTGVLEVASEDERDHTRIDFDYCRQSRCGRSAEDLLSLTH